jgi:hypothetical protein
MTINVRTLFISDVHLGTRGCQAYELLDFLKNCDSKKFNQLRDYVIGLKQASEVKPLDLTCKECSHKYKQAFTLDLSSFFEDAS